MHIVCEDIRTVLIFASLTQYGTDWRAFPSSTEQSVGSNDTRILDPLFSSMWLGGRADARVGATQWFLLGVHNVATTRKYKVGASYKTDPLLW